MACGARQNEEMPNQVSISQAGIECEKNYSECVRQPSGNQPEQARRWHFGNQWIRGNQGLRAQWNVKPG